MSGIDLCVLFEFLGINISCDVKNSKTSTPSNSSGNCSTKDQCANCIVREMLENGEINLEDSVPY